MVYSITKRETNSILGKPACATCTAKSSAVQTARMVSSRAEYLVVFICQGEYVAIGDGLAIDAVLSVFSVVINRPVYRVRVEIGFHTVDGVDGKTIATFFTLQCQDGFCGLFEIVCRRL